MKLSTRKLFVVCNFIVLLFSQKLCAQNTNYSIVGVLIDAKDASPIPYVTIQTYLANTTTKPVYACVSNNLGQFEVDIATEGAYDIVFSYIGKKSQTIQLNLKADQQINLGNISLEDQTNELGAVNVLGQKALLSVEANKITYQVSDDPQSKNSNLLQISRKIPMLTVNPEIGILLNNCNPLILINGRKVKSINDNPIFYLKNTAAAKISSIELINTPGSKYEAEESCGVVNIITKKDNASSLMFGTEADSNLGYDVYTDFGFSASKFIINGNLSYNSTNKFDVQNYSERLNKDDMQNYKLIQYSEKKLLNNGVFKALSMDISYDFDSLNTLNFACAYNQDHENSIRNQSNSMLDIADNSVYAYNAIKNSALKFGDYYLGLNYEFTSKNKKHILTFSALKELEFVNQLDDQESLPLLNYTATHFLNRQDEKLNENSLQIDYVHKLKNDGEYSLGAKSIFRNNSNLSDNYTYSSDTSLVSSNFNNTQQVFSLYSEYSFKIASLLNINTGLRLESTHIEGGYENNDLATFSTNYANLLPYFLIASKTSKAILMSLSYNAKIKRPGIAALNPTSYIFDEQNIYYGNPNLTSEYLQKISFDYSNQQKLIKQFAKLSYSFSNNSIQSTSGIVNNVYYTTYMNNGKYRDLNLYLNLSARPTTWIHASISGSTSYIKLFNEQNLNAGFTGSVNAQTSFDLPKNYYLNLNAMYKFPDITLQGKGYNFYSCNISASKAFCDEKLNIELSAINPFWKTKKYARTMNTNNFETLNEVFNMGQRFSLSVSYSINDNDIRTNKVSKEIKNNDLINTKAAQ